MIWYVFICPCCEAGLLVLILPTVYAGIHWAKTGLLFCFGIVCLARMVGLKYSFERKTQIFAVLRLIRLTPFFMSRDVSFPQVKIEV